MAVVTWLPGCCSPCRVVQCGEGLGGYGRGSTQSCQAVDERLFFPAHPDAPVATGCSAASALLLMVPLGLAFLTFSKYFENRCKVAVSPAFGSVRATGLGSGGRRPLVRRAWAGYIGSVSCDNPDVS